MESNRQSRRFATNWGHREAFPETGKHNEVGEQREGKQTGNSVGLPQKGNIEIQKGRGQYDGSMKTVKTILNCGNWSLMIGH